jgi:hypothetical protein
MCSVVNPSWSFQDVVVVGVNYVEIFYFMMEQNKINCVRLIKALMKLKIFSLSLTCRLTQFILTTH